MKIKTVNNYYTDENTYIVYDENTKNGLVIDPGYKCDGILKAAQDDGVNIKYVREKTGAKLVSGDKASINITDPDINLSYSGLGYELSAKKSDIVLKDNEELNIDGLNIKCIYTPGHTNCGVCYLINNEKLFTGDTLFLRSVGRSDLPTGDGDTLVKSIKTRIYTLDDDTEVFPGHGGQSSVGYEKKYNMYIKG